MLNIAWLITVGYAMAFVAYATHTYETIQYDRAFIGTIMVLVAYGILTYAYGQDFIKDPSKPLDKQTMKLTPLKRLGFFLLALFFVLNVIGIIGITGRYYDIAGAFGYGLFALGKVMGVYFVIMYLLIYIFYKWHQDKPIDSLQTLSKICILAYYFLILVS